MKKKEFFKYLLASYIVISMVPCVILGCFLFGSMNKFYLNEIVTSRVTMLQMSGNDVDTMISEMRTNAQQILKSNDFSTAYLQESYGNMYDVNRQLNTLCTSSDYLYDVLYYNEELKTIYTSETAFSYDRFAQYSKSSPRNAIASIEECYLRNEYSYWLPAYETNGQNASSILGYVVTSKRSMQMPNRSMIYMIETTALDNIFGNCINDMNACVMLLNNEGKSIYITESPLSHTMERLCSEENRAYETLITLKEAGKKYALYQIESKNSNLVYAILIPYDRIIQPIRTQTQISMAVYSGILLLGVIAIIYFTRKVYSPVRTVRNLAENALDMTQDNLNEMEVAHQALLVMQGERRLKRMDKEFLAALNGENTQWFSSAKSNSVPIFAVIRITEPTGAFIDADDYREFADFARRNFSKEHSIAVASLASHGCICALMHENQSEDVSSDNAQMVLTQIRNLLEYTFGVKTTIGYSSLYGKTMREAFAIAETEATHEIQIMPQTEDEEDTNSSHPFADVMQYILKNYSSPDFSAKALATDMNMSLSNFSHYFKKNMGRTFSEYLSVLRLEKAKNLLETTDMTLTDIAEQCGYLNGSAFMRSFKKQTGITPTVYRNEYGE